MSRWRQVLQCKVDLSKLQVWCSSVGNTGGGGCSDRRHGSMMSYASPAHRGDVAGSVANVLDLEGKNK